MGKNEQDDIVKAYPGKYLGYTFDYSLGDTGVYRKEDKIYASLFGEIIINNKFKPPMISVKNNLNEYIPKIGDEVYFKVSKTTKTTSFGEIVASKDKAVKIPIAAIIKSDNVKQDFRDFDMFDCFVPGDIVFCKILSVDQTNYICLSTQDVSYGVVFARSPLTKGLMMPLNFENMLCMDTKINEKRKVAKPMYS